MATKEKEDTNNVAEFLENSGLLFEINRMVLHQFGLSMTTEMRAGCQVLVIDNRMSMEGGLAFTRDELKKGTDRITAFAKKHDLVGRITDRLKLLGGIYQQRVGKRQKMLEGQ